MIPELGLYSLILAGCLALAASVGGLAGAANPLMQRWVLSITVGQCLLCALAFSALVWAFAVDDFSVAYVAGHSNSLLPWYYKISATWGGHEGSFLLWILIMSGWMLALAIRRIPSAASSTESNEPDCRLRLTLPDLPAALASVDPFFDLPSGDLLEISVATPFEKGPSPPSSMFAPPISTWEVRSTGGGGARIPPRQR